MNLRKNNSKGKNQKMNSKQTQILNLIRKIRIEKDAIFHSEMTFLDLNLPYEQSKLISTIFSEHQKNLSQILDLVKKLIEEKEE